MKDFNVNFLETFEKNKIKKITNGNVRKMT